MKSEFGDKIYTLACAPDFVCQREYLKSDACNQCCKTDLCSKDLCDTYNGEYGFQVVLESDQNNGTLVFQNVITNVGKGYDSRTGYFTPRTSGTFVFTWNVQSFGESVAACLEVNNIEITSFQTIQWVASIYKKDSFAILNLNAYDVIRIRLINGTAKSIYTVFNGWKQSVTEYLPAVYAVCSSKNCSSNFIIITNNDMFDNTSNVITIKRGFYLELQSYGGSFVFLFPRWMNETFGNLTDITLADAFGYVQLNITGKMDCSYFTQHISSGKGFSFESLKTAYQCNDDVIELDPYTTNMKRYNVQKSGLFAIATVIDASLEGVVLSLRVNNIEMLQIPAHAVTNYEYLPPRYYTFRISVLLLNKGDDISFISTSGSFQKAAFSSWILAEN
nr:uncharacterized protein LOC117685140 [Crassostrea gigas]